MTGLNVVVLKRTKATADGVRALSAALPNCRIESDHGALGPKAAGPKPETPR
jgi:hypothetical protein